MNKVAIFLLIMIFSSLCSVNASSIDCQFWGGYNHKLTLDFFDENNIYISTKIYKWTAIKKRNIDNFPDGAVFAKAKVEGWLPKDNTFLGLFSYGWRNVVSTNEFLLDDNLVISTWGTVFNYGGISSHS
jgi:hypothetical protein